MRARQLADGRNVQACLREVTQCDRKQLTQRQVTLYLTATELQVYFLWHFYPQGLFSFANAMQKTMTPTMYHTVEECRGRRRSLLSKSVLVVSIFVEEAHE